MTSDPRPEPAFPGKPEMAPVLAPIKRRSAAGPGAYLLAAAVLAAGLAMGVSFKSAARPRPSHPPPAVAAATRPLGASQAPAAPAPELEPPGPALEFKQSAQPLALPAQPGPQPCADCWNQVHSGLGPEDRSAEDDWAGNLRRTRYTSPYSPAVAQFGLPESVTTGSRLGDLPDSWQKCPTPQLGQ
jgi:hypothetical protein